MCLGVTVQPTTPPKHILTMGTKHCLIRSFQFRGIGVRITPFYASDNGGLERDSEALEAFPNCRHPAVDLWSQDLGTVVGLQSRKVKNSPLCTPGAQPRVVRTAWAEARGGHTARGRLRRELCSAFPDLPGRRGCLAQPSSVPPGRTMRPYVRCIRRLNPFWKTCTGTSQRLGTTSVSRVRRAGLGGRERWRLGLPLLQSCPRGDGSLVPGSCLFRCLEFYLELNHGHRMHLSLLGTPRCPALCPWVRAVPAGVSSPLPNLALG